MTADPVHRLLAMHFVVGCDIGLDRTNTSFTSTKLAWTMHL